MYSWPERMIMRKIRYLPDVEFGIWCEMARDELILITTAEAYGGEVRGGCTYNRRLLEQKTRQPGTNLKRERERNGERKGGLYDFYKS